MAAAVLLKFETRRRLFFDSKTLSESRREELYSYILSEHEVAVGFASVREIDRLNILRASLLAMRRAVEKLKAPGGHVLVDGRFVIPNLNGYLQTAVIRGDDRLENVAAASIVAKVTRDRMMYDYAKKYPHYGFDQHKGYGTLDHRRALERVGPCAIHRRSFAGVLPGT